MNHEPKLKRSIGLLALIMYGVGDILGSGVYGLVGKAAGEVGNAVWMAFIVSMCAAAFTGLSYASLASRYPTAGGAASFVLKGYNKNWLSYMVGLSILASAFTSIATAARIFSGYFIGVVPTYFVLAVLFFTTLLCLVTFWGIKESMGVNILFTIIELLGLFVIIFVGAKYLGKVDYLQAVTPQNPQGHITPTLLLSGAVLTFYSFIGFEDITNVSEEVINPKRNLPIGILLSLSIASIIYILISMVAVSVIPASQLAESQQPLVDVVATAAPAIPTSMYSLISMLAVANTALLNCVMASRLLFALGREGLLPRVLSRVHTKRKTPHIAILLVFIIISALAVVGDISALARSTSVLILLSYTLVNGSLILVKKNNKQEVGKFEIPYIIPVLGIVICLSMLLNAEKTEWLIASSVLAFIFILYFFIKPKKINA